MYIPDFAILGGGLVGAAIAYGLARQNQKVAILDEDDGGLGASRGNFGLVWVQGKGLGLSAYGGWTRWSADRWPDFAAELQDVTGIDLSYTQPGGLLPALREDTLERMDKDMHRLNDQPGFARHNWQVLDHSALRRRVPEIGPQVAGAIYCPQDGVANPLRLWHALHRANRQLGVQYLPGRAIDRVRPLPGGGFRLSAPGRNLEAGKIVLAAGLGNRRLAPMVGLAAPVRPSRGHIIVTERVQPFLKHLFLTIRQTDDGTVMIGDARESVGLDTGLNLGVVSEMARRAQQILPMLGRLNVVRSWAAQRVMTPDGFPIYEQSVSCPGAWLATCHSGVTLAAAHADRLAPMIVGGDCEGLLPPFSVRRFHVPQIN